MNKKIILAILITAIALISPLISLVFAVTDTATVDVTVSAVSQVEVVPTAYTFTLGPGQENFTLASNAMIIKNTGSNNLTNIYVSVNTPTVESSNPLGQAAGSYAAGGFVWVRNQTVTSYYHMGRLEWNTTTKPAGIVNDLTGAVSWGFYRNVSGDYLWEMKPATATFTQCNATLAGGSATLRIKTVADTGNNRDMSIDYVDYTVSANGTDWSSIAASSGPLNGYCVALYYDCQKFYIYKYDKTTYGTTCTNSLYLQEAALAPGLEHGAYIGISVPKGVPAGATAQSTITVTAT